MSNQHTKRTLSLINTVPVTRKKSTKPTSPTPQKPQPKEQPEKFVSKKTLYGNTNVEKEETFYLTSELWADLLKDEKNLGKEVKSVTGSYIQEKYGVPKTVASNIRFALDNKEVIHNDISVSLKKRKNEIELKELKKKNQDLLKEVETVYEKLDFVLGISQEVDDIKIRKIVPTKSTKVHEATAFAILSDVHIEERVDLDVTDGLNEYNPQIAKERLDKFFVNCLKLVNKERHSVNIDNLVLGLLGDNITGYIHEELRESNYMSPTEATRYVKGILMDGITYLLDNGNFEKITIPCCRGNHGRTTDKKRFNTAADNSFEWMMYKDMQSDFERLAKRDSKFARVEFIVPKSELTYIEVYGRIIRFGHGDHFKFAGGVGGITVPLKKWLYRMNEQRKAEMTFIGHWHSILTEVTEDCMCNGSIIGTNGYSMAFGGTPRPPQQIFTILDKDRGFTVREHIDVL